MVLPERIELSTSPLPRECSTTELRQQDAPIPLEAGGSSKRRFNATEGAGAQPSKAGAER